MKKHILRTSLIALRTLILILLTAAIAALSRIIFIDNMFEEEYFSEQVLNIWFIGFSLLIINSLVISFNRHDKSARLRYLEKVKNYKLLTNAKYVASSVDFYAEAISIAALVVLFPTSFLFGFELTDANTKSVTKLIILTITFVLVFSAHIIVQKNWFTESKNSKTTAKGKVKKPSVIKSVLMIFFVYIGLATCIPWLLPIFITLWNLAGTIIFVWIIAIVLLYYAHFFVRAILKRRSLIKKLIKYCNDNSITISDIKKPYGSIFNLVDGYNFRIEKNGKFFDCKLIAGIFPNAPIAFSDKGNALQEYTFRFFRVELFNFLTRFDFGFESEGKKILIVAPIPRYILVSVDGSVPRLADTGEVLGEYTLYNSTGFLGALDRDCL